MAENADILEMTSEIVSAYVANNAIGDADLPRLIKATHSALANVLQPSPAPATTEPKPTSSQIRRSMTDQGLVSFIDGKTYQALKRHLSTRGMTFAEYKEKFGLPDDYPITAPAYSAMRSKMAKELGLGRKPGMRRGRRKTSYQSTNLILSRVATALRERTKTIAKHVAVGHVAQF